jgi:hypothetical protein
LFKLAPPPLAQAWQHVSAASCRKHPASSLGRGPCCCLGAQAVTTPSYDSIMMARGGRILRYMQPTRRPAYLRAYVRTCVRTVHVITNQCPSVSHILRSSCIIAMTIWPVTSLPFGHGRAAGPWRAAHFVCVCQTSAQRTHIARACSLLLRFVTHPSWACHKAI